jgi:peptidoglycan hydrolase CwlO-like protein
MPTVNPVSNLEFEGEQHELSKFSEEVQALVEIYNEWNQKMVDARDEFQRSQAALQTLSNQIRAKVSEELTAEQPAPATTEPPPAGEWPEGGSDPAE